MKLLVQLLLLLAVLQFVAAEESQDTPPPPAASATDQNPADQQVTNASAPEDQVESTPAGSDTTAQTIASDNATSPMPIAKQTDQQQQQLPPSNGTDQVPPKPTTPNPVTTAPPPNPSCTIENGFNFAGNDIGYRFAPRAEDCCRICATTPNCKAFSWSPNRSGTCWLKSGRGRIVVDPQYKSALVFPSGYMPYLPTYYNIDFVDNDLTSKLASGASYCPTWCRLTPGCRAFSFSWYNGGTCWLKSKMGRTIVKNGVSSAQVYPDPIYPANGQETSTDYVNNDIGTGSSRYPEGCQSVCLRTSGCRAYSWTSMNGGTCWLKNLKGDTVANGNVVSAQVWANPSPPSCSLEIDVDYVDNDIGNAPSNDPYKCCSICMKTNGCRAFAWSDFNGGTCWLKSRKGSAIYKAGVKSAVV